MKIIRQIALCLIVAVDLVSFAQTTAKTTATPIPEIANAVNICTEAQTCVLTAVSNTAAVFQFGAGTTWCQTFTNPKLPITVSWTTPNPALCPYDPIQNVSKTLVAQQTTTAYTVTVTLAGVTTVVPVPALVPPGPTPVSTFPALCTNYSDTSFVCKATGPVVPVTK